MHSPTISPPVSPVRRQPEGRSMRSMTYDVIICGARVAGAATALLLARAGARVLLVDRAPEIADTLSTHALMRPAVELLSAWGLLDAIRSAQTPWVREARFCYGPECSVVRIRPSNVAQGLIAPRRWLLDSLLVKAAAEAGAEIRLGATVEECIRDGRNRVAGIVLCERGVQHRINAGIVVGADGRSSHVAAAVGAKTLASSPHRTATLYTYVHGIPNQGYRWYFGGGVTGGVIPTNDDQHCVFAACRSADYSAHFSDLRLGMKTILTGFDPAVAALLPDDRTERIRRFPGAPGHVRARAGDGWALVGDAAFYKDPATAHGITDALLDAHSLAACLTHGAGLAAYAQSRHDQSLRLFEIAQRTASLDWSFDELRVLHERLNACVRDELAASQAPCQVSFENAPTLAQPAEFERRLRTQFDPA